MARAKPSFPILQRGDPLAHGLVAAYQFYEGAGNVLHDASGNRNDGTLVNSPTWVGGRAGQALSFNGSSQYVSLGTPASLEFSAQPFSVSAWVKPSGTNEFGRIIGFDGGGTSGGIMLRQIGYSGTTYGGNANGYEFTIYNGASLSPTVNTAATHNGYSIGTWAFLVGVYDGTYVRLYVNGVLEDTANVGSVSPNWSAYVSDLQIGSRPGAPTSNFFPGSIDDVRIWNRALTEPEVKLLYARS